MHLTSYLSWALAVLAIYPSTVVCIPDEASVTAKATTTTSDITQGGSKSASPTSEEGSSSPHTPGPTSSVESSNSTEAATTTSKPPRPVTTAIQVTPTTSVPDLNSGASGKEVEFIASLLGFAIAFFV
ncbi:hypothetical protein PG996_010522 [Apiospora saccharicola]|uniref:Uncharacterized protein n=1 Tax=Apiospora saccharicola TaxID=335842 RepID=A0ABR1UPH0_9PEZI